MDAGIFFSAVVTMRLHPSKKDSVKTLHVRHCKKKKKNVSFDLFLYGLSKPDADLLSFTDGGRYEDSFCTFIYYIFVNFNYNAAISLNCIELVWVVDINQLFMTVLEDEGIFFSL